MAQRPFWSGQIRLSLVSLPVQIYAATKSGARIALHELDRKTGERIHHQNVADRGIVRAEDIIKGFEYEKGEYVKLEPSEINKIKLESKKTFEIIQFVSSDEIGPMYFERPYFVLPDGKLAEEAYAVVRDALKETKKIGLGQLVIGGKEQLAALKPCEKGLILETLRYSDEMRHTKDFFEDIKKITVDSDQLDLAKELIKKKTAPFKPETFHDHYREALQELINSKITHRTPKYEDKPKRKTNVVNLMDALKASLGQNEKFEKSAVKSKMAKDKTASATKAKPTKSATKRKKV